MDNKDFVSDNLLRLTGASEPTVVDFVLATASSAKSTSSLQDTLVSFLDGINTSPAEIGAFARDLHARMGKGAQPSASASKPATSKATSQKKYRLVDMGEDQPESIPSLGPANVEADRERRTRRGRDSDKDKTSSKRDSEPRSRGEKDDSRKRDRSRDAESRDRPRTRKLRKKGSQDFEDRWGDEEILEDEMYPEEFEESPSKRTRLDDGSASPLASPADDIDIDPKTKQEIERQRDLRERDEFAKRLANKESSKSKKIVEDRTRDGEAARRRALGDDASARASMMPDLRERSRQEYLKKREIGRAHV